MWMPGRNPRRLPPKPAPEPTPIASNVVGFWTDDRIATAVRMWRDEGRTASAIAEHLATETGEPCTRNAVIAKMNRMGLVGQRKRGVQLPDLAARPKPKPKPKPKPAELEAGELEAAAGDLEPAAPPAPMPEPRRVVAEREGPAKRLPFTSTLRSTAELREHLTMQEAAEAVTADTTARPRKHPGIFDLKAHHCRFPIGGPREPAKLYCGAPRVPGKAYCPDCCARAFLPSQPRRPPGAPTPDKRPNRARTPGIFDQEAAE